MQDFTQQLLSVIDEHCSMAVEPLLHLHLFVQSLHQLHRAHIAAAHIASDYNLTVIIDALKAQAGSFMLFTKKTITERLQ